MDYKRILIVDKIEISLNLLRHSVLQWPGVGPVIASHFTGDTYCLADQTRS
jgi:hypothetical protein